MTLFCAWTASAPRTCTRCCGCWVSTSLLAPRQGPGCLAAAVGPSLGRPGSADADRQRQKPTAPELVRAMGFESSVGRRGRWSVDRLLSRAHGERPAARCAVWRGPRAWGSGTSTTARPWLRHCPARWNAKHKTSPSGTGRGWLAVGGRPEAAGRSTADRTMRRAGTYGA